MARAKGLSPGSARPLLAELSDLVADLGMETPELSGRPLRSAAVEVTTPASGPAVQSEDVPPPRAARAAATRTRSSASRRRTGGDTWAALELALTAAAESRALDWPAPTLEPFPGEQPWSLLAAAAPVAAADRRARTSWNPVRLVGRAVGGTLGRLRGGGVRTAVSAGAVVVAVGVLLVSTDFFGHPLVKTHGPAEASVSEGMTLSGLRATSVSSEADAPGAPAQTDFSAPVATVVVTGTVGGGTRDGEVEFKVQRQPGPGEAVPTEVADGLRTLTADGTDQVSFTVHGVGGQLTPGTYQVEVIHGERVLGNAVFTVGAPAQ